MDIKTNSSDNYKPFYWLTLILLFIFSLVAGTFGYLDYYYHHGEEQDWIRAFYCTLQLFAFEGGDREGPIPLVLNLARFTAPLTTVMALLMALLEIFRERWRSWKISRMKNHVVIIGLGNKGRNILEESLRRKEKVLVIDHNHHNPNLASVKPPWSRCLIGDAANRNILVKAGISKAKTVFLLTGDDTLQVNACLRIHQLVKESSRTHEDPVRCIMHLQKPEFLNTLRMHKLVRDRRDGFELSIFNVYENSARELFIENPPDRTGIPEDSTNYVRMIIFGFGQAGEALALQTAYTGHYLNHKKPKVLVVDHLAKKKIPEFQSRYPAYTEFCDLDFLECDANNPQLIHTMASYFDDQQAITTIVLCFDNKTQNLMLGLQLETLAGDETPFSPRIFVRTNDDDMFEDFSQKIRPYGQTSKVCSMAAITGGDLDRQVRAVHENHLVKRRGKPDFGTRETDTVWDELSEDYKDFNRKAADHFGVKVRGVGMIIVPEQDPQVEAEFPGEHLEKLSVLEHRRWMAVRLLGGWTFGSSKNEKTRQTPDMVDWDTLAEERRDLDREVVANIPVVLRIAGLKVVKSRDTH